MFKNINNINAYKSFQKLRVIFFILLLILPFSYFLGSSQLCVLLDIFVRKI